MAETFREGKKTILPHIVQDPKQIHTEIDVLDRAAGNLRITAESTHGDSRTADFSLRVARNIDQLRLVGSPPIHERFANLLASL